ncbi:MAG: 3-keto-disaccharide hydrolase [Pirellulaceae bacterium]
MMRKSIALTLVVAFTFGSIAAVTAQEKKEWIDPAEAAKVLDYQIQGEYVGDFIEDGEKTKIGLQIIALGSGKFRAVSFTGGLPGAGWKRGDKTEAVEGALNDRGQVVFKLEDDEGTAIATIKNGKLIAAEGDKLIAKLEKVNRQSETIGMKPPKGANVLFDGTAKSAENWTRGQIVLGNLLRHDVESKAKFQDHSLHLEFRTPFMPFARGQGRGNSGMYVHGRYECQILDSFGLEGKNNECGGIYSIAEPIVNMALPPLVWQTYDVDFTAARYDDAGKKIKNARVTIKHNGVVIHDDLELTHGTPGKLPEGPEPGILYLQGHGNPVVFRNVWVLGK